MHSKMILFFLFLCCLYAGAQELDIEALFDGDFESENRSSIIEELYDLLENPLDANKANYYELQTIPWISPHAAQALIAYREHHNLEDIQELQNIVGFEQHYYIIRKFLTVKPPRFVDTRISARHRLIKKCDQHSNALQARIYNRIQLKNNHTSTGILTEKDPGESNYTDLVHAFISWEQEKLYVLLGQFKAKAGQGLVLWGPYGLRKGSNVLAPAKQRGQGITPFTSTEENSVFTGAAVQWSLQNINAFLFASHTQIDAAIDTNVITSLPNTGLHRTDLEKSRKNAAYKESAAGRLQFHSKTSDAGITLLCNRYSHPLSNDLEKYTPGATVGMDYEHRTSFMHFFGESALKNKAFAHQHGIWFEHDLTSLVVNWRMYGAHFYNSNAFAFSNENPNNERGVYIGAKHQHKQLTFSAFADRFQNPAISTDILDPGEATDFFINIEYKKENHQISTRFQKRYRWDEIKIYDDNGNSSQHYIQNKTNSIRMQMDLQAQNISLRTRIEFAFQDNIKQKSQSIYQHFSYRHQNKYIQGRVTLFNVPEYSLRLYQYENDLPGLMSNRLLYGQGSRFFVLLTWKNANFQVNTKFDYTLYSEKPGEEIQHFKHYRQISLQVDWKLN